VDRPEHRALTADHADGGILRLADRRELLGTLKTLTKCTEIGVAWATSKADAFSVPCDRFEFRPSQFNVHRIHWDQFQPEGLIQRNVETLSAVR
jgi:hypothetical protein